MILAFDSTFGSDALWSLMNKLSSGLGEDFHADSKFLGKLISCMRLELSN